MLKDRDTGVRAVLGPTNTGKTHYAIERMLGHRTGVIGLPLRLLAREVYDRIVAIRGPSVVALVTGEERIVPERVAYWVCTVEAMPLGIGADFVAIDEVQLCADPERGHVFTDRLLNERGLHETLFLGAETIRPRIAQLVPKAEFLKRERFSELRYSGPKKISRMPARSAIVGFSVDDVYAIAEVIRRFKGGAAVVMGALSPRTRNAQVAMYQNGDVDYLVATDAIGMGLNLDISHVAFSGTVKFDGRRTRSLMPHELGQIAGRAGRYQANGTFGVTGDAQPFDDRVIEAIENHRFAPISKLVWRNSSLDFHSVDGLIHSLEQLPLDETLVKARDADDLSALKSHAADPTVRDRIRGPGEVRLLWNVCQIPDFRNVGPAEHAALLSKIFGFLSDRDGRISADYLAGQVNSIDKTTGDIDTISKRLAFIRTWTYIAQRESWTEDSLYWREETRRVEDRLSDALHGALTERFVDRRTSVLLRRLKQRESLVAEVTKDGEVRVDDQFVGRLEGFRFRLDPKASGDEAKTLRSAGLAALKPEFSLRADRMYNAPDSEFDLTEQGGLMWGTDAVGKLTKGPDVLSPSVEVFVDDEAGSDIAEKVQRRLAHWLTRRIDMLFEPLLAIKKDETLTGLAKGVGFQIVEALGVIQRQSIANDVKALDQDARGLLRKHGIRFGQFTIFQTALLKPAPTRLRLVLGSLFDGLGEFPEAPPPGLVTVVADPNMTADYYTKAGYKLAGSRAIRIDMLERLADLIRSEDTRAGFEATPDMLSLTGLSHEQFSELMVGMGYHSEAAQREKVKASPDPSAETPKDPAGPSKPDEADAVAKETPAVESLADQAEEKAAPPEPAETSEAEANGPVETSTVDTAGESAKTAEIAETESKSGDGETPEIETFYTFTWKNKPRARKPQGDGKPTGKRTGGKPKRGPKKPAGPQRFQSAPKKTKEIDPDNPFAALAALKEKG